MVLETVGREILVHRHLQFASGEDRVVVALVDSSNGAADLGVPFFPLVDINFPTYAEGEVPAELAAIGVTKPGSRAA